METLHDFTDALDAARFYAARALPIIPLVGKVPAVKDWQKFIADESAVLFWFGKRRANIGLRTGESGYVVIDTDSGAAEEWVQTHCEETPMRAQSGGGSLHWYYRNPPRKEIRNRQGLRGIHGLDVRGHGGFIVLPPSLHPETGNRYEWLTGFEQPEGLPRFSPTWIYKRTRKQIHHEALCPDADFMEHRALRWLQKRDGAVSGRGGHNHTFATACKLALYFGLSRETAIHLMMTAFNPKCEPPWSLKEIEHKVDDALKRKG
jgi:hypothetical protein